jgi:succinate dehydrogenase / fumarate reductase cytochrome b subunit
MLRARQWHKPTPGFVAWALHRISGIMLAGYLFLHIWVIHHLAQGETAFNAVMALVQTPFFHFMEIGLLGIVIFHGLNGLRVVLAEYGWMGQRQTARRVANLVLAAAVVLTLIGSAPFVKLALNH